MSADVTAIATARLRKRNAVQAVKDALIELRVANRLLAVAEGRPEPRRITGTTTGSGASTPRPVSILAAGSIPTEPAALSDLDSPSGAAAPGGAEPAGIPTPAGDPDGPAADLSNPVHNSEPVAGPTELVDCGGAAPMAIVPPVIARRGWPPYESDGR